MAYMLFGGMSFLTIPSLIINVKAGDKDDLLYEIESFLETHKVSELLYIVHIALKIREYDWE